MSRSHLTYHVPYVRDTRHSYREMLVFPSFSIEIDKFTIKYVRLHLGLIDSIVNLQKIELKMNL